MLKLKLQYFGHLMLERLRPEGEEGVRWWGGWMASPKQWTWTWKTLGDVRDREAWHAVVHGITKSWTWLGNWTTTTYVETHTHVYVYTYTCVCVSTYVVVVQLPSHVQLFVIPWTTACQASLSLTSPRVFQVHVHCFGDAIQPPHHLTPSSPSGLNLSSIRWPKYWSFSFSISPSSKYSGLISLKIDWFDFLAVQGTLRSLL